jgi:hypothetical protein
MDEEKIGRTPRAAVGSRGRAGGGCIPYGVSAPVCLDEKRLAARWRNVAFHLHFSACEIRSGATVFTVRTKYIATN